MPHSRTFQPSGIFATIVCDDGVRKTGRMGAFTPSNAEISYMQPSLSHGSGPLTHQNKHIAAEKIVYVAFHKAPTSASPPLPEQLREYRLHTSLQQCLTVRIDPKALGDEPGFYAYPQGESSPFSEFFFYRQQIIRTESCEPIGAFLCREGLVRSEELEQGLSLHTEMQNSLLGQILVEQQKVEPEAVEKASKEQKLKHMQGRRLRLGEVLVESGLATEEDIQSALREQKKRKGKRLGEVLVDMGFVSEEDIARTLAKKFQLDYVDLDDSNVQPEALTETPFALLEKYRVFPFQTDARTITIAFSDPLAMEALDMLRFSMPKAIKEVLVTPSQLKRYIEPYLVQQEEQQSTREELSLDGYTMEEILRELGEETVDGEDTEELIQENVTVARSGDSAVAKLINRMIIDASRRGASDIHVEPNGPNEAIQVRIRIDGTCELYRRLPAVYRSQIVARIKIMANLDITERRKPQDGKIKFRVGKKKLELRVATLPTAGYNEDVVMRILAGGKPIPLEKMALHEYNLREFRRLIQRPYGLILVVGPTGSGKTTTLHSALASINTPERKIWTAEDPVEITQKGLRQVQVQHHIGFDFSRAMRAFLRADPDVIMVGEMRDHETAAIGIEASLTGHLVLSTLHTNSAPETITRLLDMDLDPFSFSDALLCVLAQRLARRICSQCREAYEPSPEERAPFEELLTQEDLEQHLQGEPLRLYRAEGCASCNHKGYKGRIAIHELLVSNEGIAQAVQRRAPVEEIRRLAQDGGMKTLLQDGLLKCLQGHTDIKQVTAVCSA